jgi:fatty acid desaturase
MRYRMWGRGPRLRHVYLCLLLCAGALLFCLVTNLLQVFFHFGDWLQLTRAVVIGLVLCVSLWCAHTLSILAERASVYGEIIKKDLVHARK